MNIHEISIKGDATRKAAQVAETGDIEQALSRLNLSYPTRVIVLVGGAGGIDQRDKFPMRKAIRIVARLAEETGSAVVDGGTQAGIMKELGRQRKENGFSFPLIGVVVERLLTDQDAKSILDPNHTHFFLTPGQDWGDESGWISKIATVLAGDRKSITVLVNGGNISRTDVGYSLLEQRPAFVMRGTGRLADEIAAQDHVVPVDVSGKPAEILRFLRAELD